MYINQGCVMYGSTMTQQLNTGNIHGSAYVCMLKFSEIEAASWLNYVINRLCEKNAQRLFTFENNFFCFSI